MKKLTLSLTFITSFLIGMNAQTLKYCGSDEANNAKIAADPSLQSAQQALEAYTQEFVAHLKEAKLAGTTTYVIPVVFHILHNYGPENISDAQVYDEMRILNRDYNHLNPDTATAVANFESIEGNVHFQFRLAQKDPNGKCTNGIDRIVSTLTYAGSDNAKLNPWPRNRYLNVWVVQNLSNGAAGYTYLPATVSKSSSASIDGIMMLSTYVGSIGTGMAVTSRCLTHEVGHFFNLEHPWGNTNAPGVACGDDGVTDTPVTKGWNHCPPGADSAEICTKGVVENYQNFMDYSYCSMMFTAGQATRMLAAITSNVAQRYDLWTPGNLDTTGVNIDTTINTLCTADFTFNNSAICVNTAVTYTDASWNGTPTSWNWTFPGGNPSTGSTSSVTVTYPTPGAYSASLTVQNGTQSASVTKSNIINVLSTSAEYATPYVEGFENITFPDSNWTAVTPGSTTNWTTTSSVAYSGKYCAMINSALLDSANVDELISPTFNLTNVVDPKLYFRFAYAPTSSAATHDVFKVFFSTNCGETWALHTSLTGTALATTTAQSASWQPTSLSQWKQDSINLQGLGYGSDPNVRFMFEFVSGNPLGKAGNIYLDNVNISNTSSLLPTGIVSSSAPESSFMIFPNPSKETATIQYSLPSNAYVTMQVYDLLGKAKCTLVSNQLLSSGVHTTTLQSNELDRGIYFVKLTVDNASFIKKVIIQ